MKRDANYRLTVKSRAFFVLAALTLVAVVFSALIAGGCKRKGGKSPRLNLLLITVDGMGGGRVGLRVPKSMEMPVFDHAWAQGAVLGRVIVTSPYRTPSYCSIFTGLYPPRHGVRDDRTDKLSDDVTTLAEILQKAGWRTGAVASNVDTLPLWGLNQGFDYYDNESTWPLYDPVFPRHNWGIPTPASVVTPRATSWMTEAVSSSVPWFLWVEYSDVLPPRKVPSPFSELFPDNSYAGSLAYADANIGILLGKLRDLGMSDRTLVVITSSQSLPLGEHNEININSVMFTYTSTACVPAVFMLPGKIPPGKEINTPVSSVDLMPTILSFMGITPPRGTDGRDISEAIRGNEKLEENAVYCENMYLNRWAGWRPVLSVIKNNYHFIDINPPELYDIELDFNELANIVDKDKNRTEKIKGELKNMLARIEAGKSEKENAVDAEVESKLKRLGFMPAEGAQPGKIPSLNKEEITGLIWRTWTAIDSKPDVAEQGYRKILESYPDFAFVAYMLADILRDAGSFDEAESLYKQAIIYGSRYIRASAMINLSLLLAVKKQNIEAENLLKLAQELIPYNSEAYVELGNVYLVQRLNLEAEKQFRKAIELDPASYRAHFGLASIYAGDPNRIPAAMEELQFTLKYNPDYPLAHLMIGSLAMEYFKNDAEAEKHLKKVLEISPRGPAAEDARALLKKLASGK